MKWRSSSSAAILLFFAALFVSVDSSPSGKKESSVSAKTELEKKINPSNVDEGSDDDLLARAKKSSTTTFCVEIKPGDAPAVVVCDPSKTDHQVPIPNEPAPHHPAPTPRPPTPAPYHETPNFPIPSTIPNYFPAEYPRGLDPEPNYEPLIFIPQQPQIIQPQIIPPYYQPPQILQPISAQPQIIVIPNPGCPSNSPSIISNPISPKFLYSRSSAQYNGMMEPSNYLRSSEYSPEGDMMRSIPAGSSFSGLLNNNGYTSPLDLIYAKRGNNPQQNPLTNTVTLSTGGPALVNTNQNFDGQYNRPVLIQCNPKVIPLSQEAYAAAVAGKANVNDQDFTSGMGTIQGSGVAGHHPQYMYQPGGIGQHGVHAYQTHGGMYNHQKGLPMQHNLDQYHQSNMFPYNNGHYKTASEFGPEGRAAENTEEAVKSGKVISVQQGQMMPAETFTKNMADQKAQAGTSQHISQASFNEQGLRQGVSGGDGKVLYNQDQQQKMGGQKQIEGNQNSETRFTSSSFSQGQNSFVNGDRMSKDQGLQKQMGFSQNQNQNQNLNQQEQQQVIPNALRNPGMEQKNSQQSAPGSDMQSYSQMLLQRMKSAVGQGNLVQPFMVPSSGLAGEKQTQVKV